MEEEYNKYLLEKWNNILKAFRETEVCNGKIHFCDLFEFAYPDNPERTFRLRLEVDLAKPLYDVYYGIYLTKPISAGKSFRDINNEWAKFRTFIDNKRPTVYSRSNGCSNDKDVSLTDPSQYVYWPYWVKVGELDNILIKSDIDIIKRSLLEIGFKIPKK